MFNMAAVGHLEFHQKYFLTSDNLYGVCGCLQSYQIWFEL